MAKVDADIYRILNANVAVIFKPFSFVKDSVVGEIINNEDPFGTFNPTSLQTTAAAPPFSL